MVKFGFRPHPGEGYQQSYDDEKTFDCHHSNATFMYIFSQL